MMQSTAFRPRPCQEVGAGIHDPVPEHVVRGTRAHYPVAVQRAAREAEEVRRLVRGEGRLQGLFGRGSIRPFVVVGGGGCAAFHQRFDHGGGGNHPTCPSSAIARAMAARCSWFAALRRESEQPVGDIEPQRARCRGWRRTLDRRTRVDRAPRRSAGSGPGTPELGAGRGHRASLSQKVHREPCLLRISRSSMRFLQGGCPSVVAPASDAPWTDSARLARIR